MAHNQSNQTPAGQQTGQPGHDAQTDPGEQAPGRSTPGRTGSPGEDQNEEE